MGDHIFKNAYFEVIKKIFQTSVVNKIGFMESSELFEVFLDDEYKIDVSERDIRVTEDSVVTKIHDSKRINIILALDDIEINMEPFAVYNTVVVIGMKNVHVKNISVENLLVVGKDVRAETNTIAYKTMLIISERCKYPDIVTNRINGCVFVKYNHQIDTNLQSVMGFCGVVLKAFGITDSLKISYVAKTSSVDKVSIFEIIENVINQFDVYKPTEKMEDTDFDVLCKMFPNMNEMQIQSLLDARGTRTVQESSKQEEQFDAEASTVVVNNLSSVVITQAEEPVIVGEGGDGESSPTIVGEDIVK